MSNLSFTLPPAKLWSEKNKRSAFSNHWNSRIWKVFCIHSSSNNLIYPSYLILPKTGHEKEEKKYYTHLENWNFFHAIRATSLARPEVGKDDDMKNWRKKWKFVENLIIDDDFSLLIYSIWWWWWWLLSKKKLKKKNQMI